MATFEEQQKLNLQNYINQNKANQLGQQAQARLNTWNQTGADPGKDYNPTQTARTTVQAVQNSPQDVMRQYLSTINGGGNSNAKSLADSFAQRKADDLRRGYNQQLNQASTNRDIGLQRVDSGLADAKQNAEESNFQKYLAQRQSLANSGLSGQGLAQDADTRLQIAYNRNLTGLERDANDQRYALDQQYNTTSQGIQEQMGAIDQAGMASEYYQQLAAQEQQQRTQQAQALMNYVQMMNQQQQQELDNQYRQDQFGYQQQRDQVGDQRWQTQFDYGKQRDGVEDQWRNTQFNYQQQRDQVGDQRWQTQFDYGKEQDRIKNEQWQQNFQGSPLDWFSANTSRLNSQASIANQAFDNNLSLSKALGEFRGVPGIDDGTPIPSSGGKATKISMNDIQNEFMDHAKVYQQNGGSVDQFIQERILPHAERIMREGFDVNKIIDTAYSAFTNGQFKDRKSYQNYVKDQMKANDPYGWEENFNKWMKSQQLNFNVKPKGSDANYNNYYKASRDAKANPTGYRVAQNAVGSAIDALKLPSDWLAPTLELVARESSFNPKAQNPKSTAYGMFQFLDSTWKGTGVSKTSDPTQQAIAGMKYIKQRYGDPYKALAFWDKNKWY